MSINSPWLEKFLSILDDWLDHTGLNNQFMANEMGISERQLYRKVKKLTGKSPNRFIREYRLQKAMELMQSEQFHTVQQAGFAIGYKNIHYFSKEFEKKFGESPMQVLRRIGHR